MSKYIFIFSALFALTGCNWIDPQKALVGTWQIIDINNNWQKLGTIEAHKIPHNEINEIDDRTMLYMFFADGTFAKINDKGYYRASKWSLRSAGISGGHYLVLGTQEMSFSFKNEYKKKPHGYRLTLVSAVLNTEQIFSKLKGNVPEQENPFHISHNLWRVKPEKPESLQKVEERLINYADYLRLLFKFAKTQPDPNKYLKHLSGVVAERDGRIVWEGASNWERCFYSPADAQIAYDMLKESVQAQAYKGTGNLIADGYNIFDAAYRDLKKRAKE